MITISFQIDHPRKAAILATVAILLDDLDRRPTTLTGTEQAMQDLIKELYGFMVSRQSDLFFAAADKTQWTPTIRSLRMLIDRLQAIQEETQ